MEPSAPKTPRLVDEPSDEPQPAAWVLVGAALLYVGGEAGTTVGPATAPEETQRARLAEAIADMKDEPLETVERGYAQLVERLQSLGANVSKLA